MTVEPRVEPRLLLQPTAVIRCRGVCRSVGSSCGANLSRCPANLNRPAHLNRSALLIRPAHLNRPAHPSRHLANASGRLLVRLRDGRQGWRRSRVYRRACAEPVESKAATLEGRLPNVYVGTKCASGVSTPHDHLAPTYTFHYEDRRAGRGAGLRAAGPGAVGLERTLKL